MSLDLQSVGSGPAPVNAPDLSKRILFAPLRTPAPHRPRPFSRFRRIAEPTFMIFINIIYVIYKYHKKTRWFSSMVPPLFLRIPDRAGIPVCVDMPERVEKGT